MKALKDLKCPLCNGELKHYPSKMRDFSWTDPYVHCGCGFNLRERKIYYGEKGQSAFDADKQCAIEADTRLVNRLRK